MQNLTKIRVKQLNIAREFLHSKRVELKNIQIKFWVKKIGFQNILHLKKNQWKIKFQIKFWIERN